LALYRLGPFVVRKKTAFFMLFTLRVFLFICSAAALVLAFEFPCASLQSDAVCQVALQEFHLCVYFIIVTLSTVGYGDVTCGTDAGRMLMCVVIVYAAIQVPREIQMFADLDADQANQERAMKTLTQAGIEIDANQADQIELARIMRSPSADGVDQLAESTAPIEQVAATADFSSIASPPPQGSEGRAPIQMNSDLLANSSAAATALQRFLVDDTPFLCRWAEMQLRQTITRDPRLLQRLTEAINIDGHMQRSKEEQNDERQVSARNTPTVHSRIRTTTHANRVILCMCAQVAVIVHALFSSSSKSTVALGSPPAADLF
jgi:hypothetical protein